MEPDFNYKSKGPGTPLPPRQTPPNPAPQKPNRFATLSLVAGIFGLISCCFPPTQLLFGAGAVMLAIVSKKGSPFSGPAIAGLVLGTLSIICSILMFINFVITMQLVQDPANAQIVNQVMEQYESLFNSLQGR